MRLLEYRFVYHYLYALRFDSLHDALYGGGAEIVGTFFHYQPIDADRGRDVISVIVALLLLMQYLAVDLCDDVFSDEVFAGAVGFDNGFHQTAGDFVVVGH